MTAGLAVLGWLVAATAAAWRLRPRPTARVVAAVAPNDHTADPAPPASRRSIRRHAAIAGLVVAAVAAGGAMAAAVTLLGCAIAPPLHRGRERRRRQRAIGDAFPAFVDLLVLTVRAGCTPAAALSMLTPMTTVEIAPALAAIDNRRRAGARLVDAVDELPRHLGPIAHPLAAALRVNERSGAALAPMLDRLAEDARQQRRRDADAAARRLPVELSFPLVLCTLPSFVLLTVVPLMVGNPFVVARAPALTTTHLDHSLEDVMTTPSTASESSPPRRSLRRRPMRRPRRWRRWLRAGVDRGQATTEYALVLLGAAVIALLVVGWATAGGGAGKIGKLFDRVLDEVVSRV